MTLKPELAREEFLLHKHIIIGLTILDHEDNLIEHQQLYGEIVKANQQEGVVVLLPTGHEFKLPPDFSAFEEAPPGAYRFKSTGEVVLNPDLMTTWEIRRPAPKEKSKNK